MPRRERIVSLVILEGQTCSHLLMAISSEAGYDATAGLPRSVGVVEPVPLICLHLPGDCV